jgi:hypothetical protein
MRGFSKPLAFAGLALAIVLLAAFSLAPLWG